MFQGVAYMVTLQTYQPFWTEGYQEIKPQKGYVMCLSDTDIPASGMPELKMSVSICIYSRALSLL